jgi:hypothetical protein
MPETVPVHFIIGTGRCGSTLLHEMLCRHPDIAFMSNLDDRFGAVPGLGSRSGGIYRRLPPRFTEKGRFRFAPSEGYRAMSKEVSPILATSSRDLLSTDATPWLMDRVRKFFGQYASAQSDSVLLHKLTGWPRAGFLGAIFPDARFVHVVRDGRAVANSWLQMPWWKGYAGPENWHWGEIPPAYRDSWDESGRSFVVLAGIAWMMLIDAWEASRALLPASAWLDVRYEDLVAEPLQTTTAVLEFLGVPYDDRFTAQLDRYTFDPTRTEAYRTELGNDNIAQLEAVAGNHLRRYGYDDPGASGDRA